MAKMVGPFVTSDSTYLDYGNRFLTDTALIMKPKRRFADTIHISPWTKTLYRKER